MMIHYKKRVIFRGGIIYVGEYPDNTGSGNFTNYDMEMNLDEK